MALVAGNGGKVQVRFVTKQEQYAVQDIPYAIDVNVTSADLNKLVNTLLDQLDSKCSDFDFLVTNQYLQTTLLEHLKNNSISFENVIEVEYVEKFPSPEPQDCLLHDDWVSAVATKGNWIITGSYDNTINLWTTKGTHMLTITGHTMPVKALSWISLDEREGRFVSVSQDQTAIVWKWDIGQNGATSESVYKGHQRGIDCVGLSPDSGHVATGSWDTMLKIWRLESSENNDDVIMKNREPNGITKTPIITLQGHKENISAVHWMDSARLISGAWDQTLKIWNLNLEGIESEIVANKSFFDISYSPLNHTVIAALADKNLRLYDPRSNQNLVIRCSYMGHTQWVQTVAWSTTEEHLFLSGGYDNQNKLWDSRSTKAALYDLIGHNDKVLDVDWSNPKYVVSGGADNTVRIYKSRKAIGKE